MESLNRIWRLWCGCKTGFIGCRKTKRDVMRMDKERWSGVRSTGG